MTATGRGAGPVGLALVAVGLFCHWAPVVVLGAGILLLLAGAGIHVARRPHVALTRTVEPRRVEKGRPAIAVVEAVNLSRRSLAPTEFEQMLGGRLLRAVLPRLGPQERATRSYELPTSMRGTYDIGPMVVPRADPFGLCRTVQTMGSAQRLSVHPRLLHLRPLPTGVSRHLEGPSSDSSPQGSVTFHRLREYVVGDDLRNVHWPSTARVGQLVVRHHVDTAQPQTVVLLDLECAHYTSGPDALEEAIDVAASVCVSLASGRAPVQLRTTGGDRIGGSVFQDPAVIVDFLTDVAPSAAPSDGGGGLEAELVKLRRDRGGTALVVVTGDLDLNGLPGIAGLRRRFDRVIVFTVTDAPERAPGHPAVTVIAAATAHEAAKWWNSGAAR